MKFLFNCLIIIGFISSVQACGKVSKTEDQIYREGVYAYVQTENGAAIIDTTFSIIKDNFLDKIPNIYLVPHSLSSNLFVVAIRDSLSRNGKYGVVDVHGNVKVPFDYSSIWNEYKPDEILVCNSISQDISKSSIMTSFGRLLTNNGYVSINSYKDGFFRVAKSAREKKAEGWTDYYSDWRFGFLDKDGKEIISCNYYNAQDFSEGFAAVEDDYGKWGFIDKTGELVVPHKYYKVSDFSCGLALVQDENGLYGYVDDKGREVIPLAYLEASSFRHGIAFVRLKSDDYAMSIINTSGKELFPNKDYYDFCSVSSHIIAVDQIGGRIKLIDFQNKYVPNTKEYNAISQFSKGFAVVVEENEYRGMIDSIGNEIIPCNYDNIIGDYSDIVNSQRRGLFSEFEINGNLVFLQKNNKWGVFNTDLRKLVVPCIYEMVKPNKNLITVILNHKVGFFKQDGSLVVEPIYDETDYLVNPEYELRLLAVRKDDKWGYINLQGQVICPFIYKYATSFISYRNE